MFGKFNRKAVIRTFVKASDKAFNYFPGKKIPARLRAENVKDR